MANRCVSRWKKRSRRDLSLRLTEAELGWINRQRLDRESLRADMCRSDLEGNFATDFRRLHLKRSPSGEAGLRAEPRCSRCRRYVVEKALERLGAKRQKD